MSNMRIGLISLAIVVTVAPTGASLDWPAMSTRDLARAAGIRWNQLQQRCVGPAFHRCDPFVRLGRGKHTHPDLSGEHGAYLNDCKMRDNNPALRFAKNRHTLGGPSFRMVTLCKRA